MALRRPFLLLAFGLLLLSSITIVWLRSSVSAPTDCTMFVEWPDTVRLHNITYIAVNQTLPHSALGSYFDTTTFQAIGTRCSTELQDHEAAILPVGTDLYTLSDYHPTFRLAVKEAHDVRIYEVSTNPRAQHGADFFDFQHTVTRIDVVEAGTHSSNHRRIRTITDSHVVELLVDDLRSAWVQKGILIRYSEPAYVLVFHLVDGTSTSVYYWVDVNMTGQGLQPPLAFARRIRSLVQSP